MKLPGNYRCPLALALSVLCLGAFTLTGCRYCRNRVADFCDIVQLGGGVATEDPTGGPFPPSLGFHVQATEFLNLSAMHFHGYSAEWDGRGFFAGPETRTRLGLGPLQMIRIDQNYERGVENYFKKANTPWERRMTGRKSRWWNAPAKQLNWALWRDTLRWGTPVFHRGWQYWENFAVEAAVCEPLLTHAGVSFRAGLDVSEAADFALGILMVDFKRDDLTRKEFDTRAGKPRHARKEHAKHAKPTKTEKAARAHERAAGGKAKAGHESAVGAGAKPAAPKTAKPGEPVPMPPPEKQPAQESGKKP